jgi:hypothetical protein
MKPIALSLVFVASVVLNSPLASADTLLIDRVQAEQGVAVPMRGTSMAQVKARFGEPTHKFAAISGPNDREDNPPITRWAYPNFIVYFEYSHVIDAVLTKASPQEIGPAPAQN